MANTKERRLTVDEQGNTVGQIIEGPKPVEVQQAEDAKRAETLNTLRNEGTRDDATSTSGNGDSSGPNNDGDNNNDLTITELSQADEALQGAILAFWYEIDEVEQAQVEADETLFYWLEGKNVRGSVILQLVEAQGVEQDCELESLRDDSHLEPKSANNTATFGHRLEA